MDVSNLTYIQRNLRISVSDNTRLSCVLTATGSPEKNDQSMCAMVEDTDALFVQFKLKSPQRGVIENKIVEVPKNQTVEDALKKFDVSLESCLSVTVSNSKSGGMQICIIFHKHI